MAFADEITEKKRIKIGESCTTDPVYLTWLNEYGGSSFWLFKKIDKKIIDTSSEGYHEKYLSSLIAQGNDSITRKTVELSLILGARIEQTDTDGMNGLFKSPKVKMLNLTKWNADSTIEWTDVRIKDGSMIYYDNNNSYITLEFEILLPKQYVISE